MAIKIKSEELRKYPNEKLEEMRKDIEIFIMQKRPKNRDDNFDKGVNIREAKRNVARINTILRERK